MPYRGCVLAGTAALAVSVFPALSVPINLDQLTTDGRGDKEVSITEAVHFNWGIQGQTQGAGTPNAIGIGGFVPLVMGTNRMFFLDALANVNLADIGNSSSIINTEVTGTTISSSTRLGYRWLTRNKAWMFGFNAGYDSRPMATGLADTSVNVSSSRTVFYQQVAGSLEAVSNDWNFNAYALVPIGDTEQHLNSAYSGGALDTYGLDFGYNITPNILASVGYYYQNGDLNTADGSGIRGRLSYNLINGLTAGANISYDAAFLARFSADIKYRFGSNSSGSPQNNKKPLPKTLQSLSASPDNRDVRVHDTSDAPGLIIQSAGGDCAASIDPSECREYF